MARRGSLRFDTAVGVLFAGMFAFGILLFSSLEGYVADLFGYLLGNVLGIGVVDLVQVAILGGAVLVAVAYSARSSCTPRSIRPAPRRRACRWRRSTTCSSGCSA